MQILIGKLPQPRKWRQRRERDITQIVIHHDAASAPPLGREVRHIKAEAEYHINVRRWPGLAYHYMIDKLGGKYKTSATTNITYHVAGANPYSIGVTLMGNFNVTKPSEAALDSLRELVKELKRAIPTIKRVIAHRNVKGSRTECPGRNLTDSTIAELNKLVM